MNGVSPKFNTILLHIKFGQITKKCREKAKKHELFFPAHIMYSFRSSLRAITNVISSLCRYREIIPLRNFSKVFPHFLWVLTTLKFSNLILYRVNNWLIRFYTFNLLLLFTLCKILRRPCQTWLVNGCEMEPHVLVINMHLFKICAKLFPDNFNISSAKIKEIRVHKTLVFIFLSLHENWQLFLLFHIGSWFTQFS